MEPCDCTADCGDCPGIKLGTHSACNFKQASDSRRTRQHKAEILLKKLGYTDTLEALEALRNLTEGKQ